MSHPQATRTNLGKRQRDERDDSEGEVAGQNALANHSNYELGDDDDVASDGGYTEQQESYPQHPIYDPDMKDIQAGCVDIVKDIIAVLDGHGRTTESVKGFLTKARLLLDIPQVDPVRVALLGDTGVGKSSTSNSLLDDIELAKEGSSGKACTCVSVELRREFPGQTKDYAAQACYYDEQGLEKYFKELLSHCNLSYHGDHKDWTTLDKQQHHQSTKTAVETLFAIFLNRPEFRTLAIAKASLKRSCQHIYIDATAKTMRRWTLNILRQRTGIRLVDNRYTEYFEATTAKELRKLIDPLTTAMSSYSIPALWPLVQKVSINVRKSRVLQNLTICDNPGTADIDQNRVNTTLESLKTCDVLWIVARLDRIATDSAVQTLLQRYAERFEGKVAIIATRADDMNMVPLAEELELQGCNLSEYNIHTKRALPAEETARRLNGRLMKLTAKRHPRMAQTQEELNLKRWEANDANTKRLGALVKVRNAFVTENLRQASHENLPKNMRLAVFPVSNRHYAALKGGQDLLSPCLDAHGTGLPALRSYALSLAAPPLLQAFEKYVNHQFSVFVKGLDLWANSQHAKGPDDLRKIVDRPQDTYRPIIRSYVAEVEALVQQKLSAAIVADYSKYAEAAQRVVKSWHSWHWCSVRNWVLKNGAHESATRPWTCWNDQFMEPLVKNMINPVFEDLKKESTKLFTTMQNDLEGLLMNIIAELTDEPDVVALPLGKFEDLLRAQLAGVRDVIRRQQEAYFKELANIKLNATQHSATNYFTKAMVSCYRKCQEDSGQGYKARVLYAFDFAFALQDDASPFVVMVRSTSLAVIDNAKSCADNLTSEYSKILDGVRAGFDAMFDDAVPNANEVPVRRVLKAYLDGKRAEIEALKEKLVMVKGKEMYMQRDMEQV